MRELFPTPAEDVVPLDRYGADDRTGPGDRPWVIVSMVASVDGATAVDGRSGALGGSGDRLILFAMRSVADVILVAAGTVRAEHYGPPISAADVQRRRLAAGRAPSPRLAVVSRSLDLDPGARFFAEAEPGNRPWLVTTEDADPQRLAELRPLVDDVIVAGTGSVDLGQALAAISERGAGVVLSEGGPTLNGLLVGDGLIDEFCLTVAPDIVAGPSHRVAAGGAEHRTPLVLDRVLEQDDALFLRYRRAAVMA